MTFESKVIFTDTAASIDKAVHEAFTHFGGLESILKPSRNVCLKINAVDHKSDIVLTKMKIIAKKNYFVDLTHCP